MHTPTLETAINTADLEAAVARLNEAYGTKGRYQLVRTAADPAFYAIQKCVGLRLENDSPWITAAQMSLWIRAQIAAIETIKRRALREKERQLVGERLWLSRALKDSVNRSVESTLALLPGKKLGGKS